jgi:hypothetical protein
VICLLIACGDASTRRRFFSLLKSVDQVAALVEVRVEEAAVALSTGCMGTASALALDAGSR